MLILLISYTGLCLPLISFDCSVDSNLPFEVQLQVLPSWHPSCQSCVILQCWSSYFFSKVQVNILGFVFSFFLVSNNDLPNWLVSNNDFANIANYYVWWGFPQSRGTPYSRATSKRTHVHSCCSGLAWPSRQGHSSLLCVSRWNISAYCKQQSASIYDSSSSDQGQIRTYIFYFFPFSYFNEKTGDLLAVKCPGYLFNVGKCYNAIKDKQLLFCC